MFDEIERLGLEFELGTIEPQDYQLQMDELRRAAAECLRTYEMKASETADESPTPNVQSDLLEERIRLRRLALRHENDESS